MKSKQSPNSSKRSNGIDAFTIPDAVWPSGDVVTEIVASMINDKPPTATQPARVTPDTDVKTDYFKVLISVATNAWRARAETLDAQAGGIRADMTSVGNHIDAIYRDLAEFGIVIYDHTGEAYDEGQSMKVIASKPTQGLDKKRVTVTVLPSILWNNRLIQRGEVEIATPPPPDMPTESQSLPTMTEQP